MTIFNGKIHYKWQFLIAMLAHQRVMAARYQAYSSEQGHCVVSCDMRGLVWQLVRGRAGLYPFGYFATGTAADGLRAFPMGPQRVLNPIHRGWWGLA